MAFIRANWNPFPLNQPLLSVFSFIHHTEIRVCFICAINYNRHDAHTHTYNDAMEHAIGWTKKEWAVEKMANWIVFAIELLWHGFISCLLVECSSFSLLLPLRCCWCCFFSFVISSFVTFLILRANKSKSALFPDLRQRTINAKPFNCFFFCLSLLLPWCFFPFYISYTLFFSRSI